MATTNEPTREPSVTASLDKEKIEVEQRERETETAPTAEDIEFRKAERKVVAKLDLVRFLSLSLSLLTCPSLSTYLVCLSNPN